MPSEAKAPEPTKIPVPEHVRAAETALRLLHATGRVLDAIPSSTFDLRPLARTTERAIVDLLDALDARKDPLGAVRDAMARIDEAVPEARAVAGAVEGTQDLEVWLGRARGWLLVTEAHFARSPPQVATAQPWVIATRIPHVHDLPRASLAPVFRVADPVAPPPTVEPPAADLPAAQRVALLRERASRLKEEAARKREEAAAARAARGRTAPAAAPPPGFVAGTRGPITPARRVERRAREMFEEVTLAGLQRTPLLGDEWRSMDVVDQRMLRAVDALVALGPDALAAVEPLAIDRPAKDPAAGFAAVFTLGCFSGRDALAAAERVFRQLGPDDREVRAAVGGALKLAPHPDCERVLRAWLRDEDPGVRAVAVDVLGHRGWLTEEEVGVGVGDASLDVVAAALRWGALGPVSHRVHLRAAMLAHEGAEHAELERARAWALVVGDLAHGVEELAGWLGTPRESVAALPLALAGDRAVALRLVAAMQAAPDESLIHAVGFAGPAEALPALVAVLADRSAPSELKLAAAFALQRITGLEAFDDVELPPERLEAEVPKDPPGVPAKDESLTRRVSDRRDLPADGSPDLLKLPSPRAEVWQRYLARESVRYAGPQRFRRGRPYTPSLTLEELDGYAVTPDERRALFAELVLKTGEVVHLDPHDFVVVQEAGLRRWAPVAERASSRAGSWSGSARR